MLEAELSKYSDYETKFIHHTNISSTINGECELHKFDFQSGGFYDKINKFT
jgi:hypothetical protein